jgi:hypothetical protein
MTMTFAAWALWAVAFLSLHVNAWFESRDAIVCADRRALFSSEQGADHQPHLLLDDGRLVVIDSGARFPFSLRSALGGIPQPDTLRIVDRSSGRTLSALTATIDGRWSSIGRVFAWSDQMLVWTYIESRDPATGNPHRSYRRFLTDGQTEIDVPDDAAFAPRAIDVRQQRIASLEERERIMGGQPKEHELPPQTVRIESLAGPEPESVANFPVRRALRFFFVDGALMVLRWEGETVSPYWEYRYRIFLDRHDMPDYATTWSVELTPQPTPQGHGNLGPNIDVAQAQSVGSFTLRYLDEFDGFVVREIQVDTSSGEILASSMQDNTYGWKTASASRGAELVWRTRGVRNCVYEASTE